MNPHVLYPQVITDENPVPIRPEKCSRCGSTTFTTVNGWPGEHLFSCTECKAVNGGYFDPAEHEYF